MTTASNVRVAVTGGIYQGPAGSPLPTDASTALDGGIEELGYASEDGIVQAIGTDTSVITAWQNGDNVRTLQTSHDVTYALTMLETNPKTLEVYYGNFTPNTDPGAGPGSGTVEVRATMGARGVWVAHIVDGLYRIRLVIPDGEVTERGDVSYVNGDAISYPITITAYPDSTGVKSYMYLLTPPVTPPED